jgi:hypothetical protein
MTPRPATRRELLVTGAAGTAMLLASAGPAIAATTADASTPVTETEWLARMMSIELLALFCYRHILASSILGPMERVAVTPLPGDYAAHLEVLGRRLRARGGAAPAGPATVAAANRDLVRRKVGGRLGQLRGKHDAIYLLLELEQVVVGVFFVVLTHIEDASLIVLVSQMMACGAQHEAVLGLQLPPYTPQSAAPYGLIQGIQ